MPKTRIVPARIGLPILAACAGAPKPLPTTTSLAERTTFMETAVVAEGDVTYAFCEAEPEALDRCASDSQGLKANGLGGLFVPLRMNVRSIDLAGSAKARTGDLDARINAIPVACSKADLTYEPEDAVLGSNGFYCNWMGIGNVLTSFDFSISEVDAAGGTFAGTYRIGFRGTGNGGGSGVFLARKVETKADETADADVGARR